MKSIARILFALVGLALASTSMVSAGAEHGHAGHHGKGSAKLQLDHGRKWGSDEALRNGMDAMRSSLAGRIGDIHHGKLTPEDYQALGRGIESEVANIVAQCKLPKKTDAMLHIVIAELINAADVMQGKAGGKPAAAAHRAINALNSYGRHFDHPGWVPLK